MEALRHHRNIKPLNLKTLRQEHLAHEEGLLLELRDVFFTFKFRVAVVRSNNGYSVRRGKQRRRKKTSS